MRAQAEDSLCPGARVGGHSNHGLFPFPWLGVDLIKRETHDLLALFRTEGDEMMNDWLGSQAEVGKRQKRPSSHRVGAVVLAEVRDM